MNNKLKIVLEIIAVLLLIVIVVNIVRSNISENSDSNSETETKLSEVKYDENTGEYYIEDEETGEVVHTSYNENDFYIYSIDPDYDPKNPDESSEYDYEDTEIEE